MMLEQTQKIFKSPAIQKLMQVQKDFIERMNKSGYYDNSERMQELMLPTAFLNIPLTKEDEQVITETADFIENPDTEPREVIEHSKLINELLNELRIISRKMSK